MRNVCCFDIGGTFTKFGVISEKGELLFSNKFETPKKDCKDTIPVMLVKLIGNIRENYDIDCIGVSTAGKVGNGRILYASTILPDYTGADIKGFVEEKTTLRCEVDNDTYCAAIGEMWKGTAQGHRNFATITYGTGIGGALIINGEIYRGANLGAMGIGHLIIDMDGIDCTCNCQMKGVYESYASIPSLLKDFNVSGEKFIDMLREENKEAKKAYRSFINHISFGLVNVIHMLDPGLLIIGGGLMEQAFVVEDIKQEVKKNVLQFYKTTEIKSAKLGNLAGLYGATYLALK